MFLFLLRKSEKKMKADANLCERNLCDPNTLSRRVRFPQELRQKISVNVSGQTGDWLPLRRYWFASNSRRTPWQHNGGKQSAFSVSGNGVRVYWIRIQDSIFNTSVAMTIIKLQAC